MPTEHVISKAMYLPELKAPEPTSSKEQRATRRSEYWIEKIGSAGGYPRLALLGRHKYFALLTIGMLVVLVQAHP